MDYKETALTFTADQLIGQNWSVGARYRISEATLQGSFPEVPDSAIWQDNTGIPKNQDESGTLQQLNLHAIYNHRCGFFAGWESLWTMQTNEGYDPALPGDNFWQHNIYVGYRFLQRRAEVRLGLLNLTDQDYYLNPLNLYSELPRGRTFTARLRINF
jgi:outer membrane receptor protein involved in Fe transport